MGNQKSNFVLIERLNVIPSSMQYSVYLPDGTKTHDIEVFISAYSKKYFQDYPKNNESTENKIISIVKKGRNIEPDDVITLMRWKTGDVKIDGDIVDCYGRHISLNIGEKVIEAIKLDMGQSDMSIYQALSNQNMSGVGTVYLLTLVWAISGMEYPIYDKFAKIAITSICEGIKPSKGVYKYPPDKMQINLVEKMYLEYQKQLTDVFGNEWKTRREIDQALWTYGHQKF